MKFDVVVVGAGPGGGMAALTLASAGIRVLLIEKAKIPRVKPCGGGLTPGVEAMVGLPLDSVIEARISAARWWLDYDRKVETQGAAQIVMVNRRRFDTFLTERALDQNRGSVALRDGCEVTGVEEAADGVVITTAEGERISAEYVIGADGALGKVARTVGLARRTRPGVAIDAEIEIRPEIFASERDFVTFNFNCIPNGYGWTFPKDGYLACGVGSWGGRVRLPAAMDAYLNRSFPSGSILSEVRYGHPIPIWCGPAQISTPRICLVGDAASLVDPIMGEGIRFALQSGKLAAEVIVALLGGKWHHGERPVDCLRYTRLINAGIGAEFEKLRKLVMPLFMRSPEFFFRQFYEGGLNYFTFANGLASRFTSAFSAAPSALTSTASRPPLS